MTAKTELSAFKRRTRAEVQQLVAEFVGSGMRRSELCKSRGLSFSTLDRHLKKRRWKGSRKPISSAGRSVPVELAARKSPTQHEPSCGLAVVLSGGRRIEVHPDLDMNTVERLVSVLERVQVVFGLGPGTRIYTLSSVSLVLVMCFCDAQAANLVLESGALQSEPFSGSPVARYPSGRGSHSVDDCVPFSVMESTGCVRNTRCMRDRECGCWHL